jgi:hypothetical protein
METLDDPGCPDPGALINAGPGGSNPTGGVRFAPSGTFGAVVVSAGASDAGAPSSAVADSSCANALPKQSRPLNPNAAKVPTSRVVFTPTVPFSVLGGVSCSAWHDEWLTSNLRGAR